MRRLCSFELYDFGDDWRHEILFEGTLLAEPDAYYPRCIAGARNGPPEDVGGAHGYADYLEALADPDHEEHGEKLAWRGPFDPEAFSLEAINAALKRTFYRRPKSIIPRAKAEGSVTPDAGEDPDVENLTRFMLAALRGGSTEAVPKTRIAPGTTLPLELTVRERELILNHSFAPDELTARLRVVPQPGAAECIVRYTLNDLDELAGFAASESNHASDSKLHHACPVEHLSNRRKHSLINESQSFEPVIDFNSGGAIADHPKSPATAAGN